MGVQYAHAKPGYEFRPTDLGKRKYFMGARFDQKPEYREKVPKRWLSMGWVIERRVGFIK